MKPKEVMEVLRISIGALNILRVGVKLLKLDFYNNLKVLFTKLCNPLKLKLVDFFVIAKKDLKYVETILEEVGGKKQLIKTI